MRIPGRIYGIDFSGAKDAGKRIWIAEGRVREDALLIENCFSASGLPDSGIALTTCLPALRDFIVRKYDAAFGLDFPFGLPKKLVQYSSWEEFILAFPSRYDNPDAFQKACFRAAGEAELKRLTDIESWTPFSPYNIRIYRQTYYGISKLLHPLVAEDMARVIPMQNLIPGKPAVLEICPGSTLKAHNLYTPYKATTRADARSPVRSHILESIERTGSLKFERPELRHSVVADRKGDALDSVIAAFAAYRAFREVPKPRKHNEDYLVEGYVYR